MNPLPLAQLYARFRDAVFAGIEEPATLPGLDEPLTELDLQSLWFSGAFGSEFNSTDGESVHVTDFGTWNSGPGPDFTGCAITIAGAPRRGDIELDPDMRDWERHQHGANQDYSRVILHVVLQAPAGGRFFTRTVEHRHVPQVLLKIEMLGRDAKPNRGLAAARIGRCAAPLRDMPDAKVHSMLEAAAQYRLELKAERLHRCAAAQGRAQAIYQAVGQALGYRNNQQPFLLLAQRLPLASLLKLPTARRESLLFGVAGFLDAIRFEETTADTREYLRRLWSEWWRVRGDCEKWLLPRQLPRWRLAATRPGNHPQRRIGALAAMLSDWQRVAAPLLDSTRWSQAGWRATLQSLHHDYWDTHYTLNADAAARPIALIGESRIQEMLANVAYPLLVPERTRLWAEYLELPAVLDNQKLRRAVLRLFGDSPRAAPFLKKLHHQQGLLQVYEDFCLEDDSACADCPFPERLKEWG